MVIPLRCSYYVTFCYTWIDSTFYVWVTDTGVAVCYAYVIVTDVCLYSGDYPASPLHTTHTRFLLRLYVCCLTLRYIRYDWVVYDSGRFSTVDFVAFTLPFRATTRTFIPTLHTAFYVTLRYTFTLVGHSFTPFGPHVILVFSRSFAYVYTLPHCPFTLVAVPVAHSCVATFPYGT